MPHSSLPPHTLPAPLPPPDDPTEDEEDRAAGQASHRAAKAKPRSGGKGAARKYKPKATNVGPRHVLDILTDQMAGLPREPATFQEVQALTVRLTAAASDAPPPSRWQTEIAAAATELTAANVAVVRPAPGGPRRAHARPRQIAHFPVRPVADLA